MVWAKVKAAFRIFGGLFGVSSCSVWIALDNALATLLVLPLLYSAEKSYPSNFDTHFVELGSLLFAPRGNLRPVDQSLLEMLPHQIVPPFPYSHY